MTALDRTAFGAETTTAEVIAGIDLTGKTALVTGGAGGLGAETARTLAGAGAAVTLAVRDPAASEEIAASIRSASGNDAVDMVQVDLCVPDSVRACAKSWLADHDELHLLINNAGVMACPLARTREGWELQFAGNHLGHFLLTALLAPALRAAAPARVVNLSSGGHRVADVDFDDIHFERREYDKWVAYGQSKTANVLFTCALDRRLRSHGVRAYAVHPGVIMTGLGRHLTPEDIQELMARDPSGNAFRFKTAEAGAATTVWAATAPELAEEGGIYLEDCGRSSVVESEIAPRGYMAYAVDPDSAARLWRVSEEHVGETFEA